MPTGQKHLIKCRCVLLQYKRTINPPAHQFVVFSIVGDDDKVLPKFAQCNNCGIIHKVTELGRSELVGREGMTSLLTIDDVRTSVPPALAGLLDGVHADLPTWELARFICENKRWGDFVVLSSESEAGVKEGKYVRILGENLFKVETYMRDEVIR